ncbi:MAG TPA: ABC transporter substrate-binding protein [Gammaproteobacteria bacterium]|nr:ABC transporter substrate-binding protein [Gammaproteobacteria bacterium]
MIRKAKILGLASVLTMTIGATAASAAPLKIGALMPMTGDLQAYGETSLNGVKLAAKEINDAGGVLGEDVEVKVGDTQTRPQAGVDAANKLASIEGVKAFVGALSSGVTIPVAQSVSKVNKIPQLSNASTSPVITTLGDDDFLFRTVPSDAFQGVALAQVTQEQGYKTVGVVYVNNDYGKGLADSFDSAFTKLGGKVTAKVAYEQGQPAYRGELQKAAKGDTDALVLVGYPENGQTIIRQALEGGYFSKFVFTDGLKAPELIQNIGAQYMNGTVGTAPQARGDTPAAKHFKSAYSAMYGQLPPKPYIDTAYDAVYAIALAAQKAGSTDSVAIRDALRDVANPPGEKVGPGDFAKAAKLIKDGKDIDYEGASGSINFDKNGDVPGTFAYWAIEDGKIVTKRVFQPKM